MLIRSRDHLVRFDISFLSKNIYSRIWSLLFRFPEFKDLRINNYALNNFGIHLFLLLDSWSFLWGPSFVLLVDILKYSLSRTQSVRNSAIEDTTALWRRTLEGYGNFSTKDHLLTARNGLKWINSSPKMVTFLTVSSCSYCNGDWVQMKNFHGLIITNQL